MSSGSMLDLLLANDGAPAALGLLLILHVFILLLTFMRGFRGKKLRIAVFLQVAGMFSIVSFWMMPVAPAFYMASLFYVCFATPVRDEFLA